MDDKEIKKYRVIVIHQPVQFLLKTDKIGVELNEEVAKNVLKTKTHPAEILCSEIKNAKAVYIDVKKEKKK